jgi:hypothetical protein
MRAFTFDKYLSVFPILDWLPSLNCIWVIGSFSFGFIPGMVLGATKDFNCSVAAVHKRLLR